MPCLVWHSGTKKVVGMLPNEYKIIRKYSNAKKVYWGPLIMTDHDNQCQFTIKFLAGSVEKSDKMSGNNVLTENEGFQIILFKT